MRKTSLIVGLVIAALPGLVAAQEMGKPVFPDKIDWKPAPPALPKGAMAVVLSGDPGKAGPFILRLKMPAGYKVPAHQHPSHEAITVLAGDFNVGMGDKLDEAKAEKLTAGTFIDLPGQMNHFGFSVGEAIIQVSGDGPFALKYVNEADDPRNVK